MINKTEIFYYFICKFNPKGANIKLKRYICTRKGLFDFVLKLIVPERDNIKEYEIR